METQMQMQTTNQSFGDHIISFLGGLVVGSAAWGVFYALAAIIQAAAPPGLNLLEVITSVKLVPPPGIDLSRVTIVIPLPAVPAVEIAFVAVPLLVGLVVAFISYKRILRLG